MKPSHAASLALVLVVLGWLLCVFGILAQLGDPAPGAMLEHAAHQRQMSVLVLLGVIGLIAALWLAGYSFRASRIRSLLSFAAVVLPVVAIFIGTFVW